MDNKVLHKLLGTMNNGREVTFDYKEFDDKKAFLESLKNNIKIIGEEWGVRFFCYFGKEKVRVINENRE